MVARRLEFAVSAVFLLFFTFSTSSNESTTLFSDKFRQIAQQFAFPLPKLPNISFANVGKQCKDTVDKLRTTKLAYQCEYKYKSFEGYNGSFD